MPHPRWFSYRQFVSFLQRRWSSGSVQCGLRWSYDACGWRRSAHTYSTCLSRACGASDAGVSAPGMSMGLKRPVGKESRWCKWQSLPSANTALHTWAVCVPATHWVHHHGVHSLADSPVNSWILSVGSYRLPLLCLATEYLDVSSEYILYSWTETCWLLSVFYPHVHPCTQSDCLENVTEYGFCSRVSSFSHFFTFPNSGFLCPRGSVDSSILTPYWQPYSILSCPALDASSDADILLTCFFQSWREIGFYSIYFLYLLLENFPLTLLCLWTLTLSMSSLHERDYRRKGWQSILSNSRSTVELQ